MVNIVPEPLVEPSRQIARQLQMLLLVVSDRDKVRVVQQNISGHQRRIHEQARADGIFACRFILELRHPLQLAHGKRRQQPAELRMLRYVGLHEHIRTWTDRCLPQ